jgi:hypothetical protein
MGGMHGIILSMSNAVKSSFIELLSGDLRLLSGGGKKDGPQTVRSAHQDYFHRFWFHKQKRVHYIRETNIDGKTSTDYHT